MLSDRKKSFIRAHAMLQTLRTSPNDISTLRQIQQLLIREIVKKERKIREIKAEIKNIETRKSGADAKRSSLEIRVERLRESVYIWRCFGDAIAFIYMDKFALKQCFYSTENANPKQSAGFIADKSGVKNEILRLESALREGIPALLVDLTNTIRHGDVCLMGEPAPYLIEEKTSKRLDSRGKRQQRSLEKIHSFLETDQAESLRGFPHAQRVAFERPERTYINDLNACISSALETGYAVREPEHGLLYIAITKQGISMVNTIPIPEQEDIWAFALNEIKNQGAWSPYLPFTLSIANRDHLWAFIRGELYILVLIETANLCRIAAAAGCEAKFNRDDTDRSLQIGLPGADQQMKISSHLLARIGMEFVSPEWIVLTAIDSLKRALEHSTSDK